MENLLLNNASNQLSIGEVNILYVEADNTNKKSVAKALTSIYKKVYTASNNKEAVEIFFNQNIDLVIVDLYVSDSSMKLLKKIKEISPNTPCIVTFADANNHTLLDLIAYGINHIVMKPYTIEKLNEEIIKAYKGVFYYQELIKKYSEIEKLNKILESQINEMKSISTLMQKENDHMQVQYTESRKTILKELKTLFE